MCGSEQNDKGVVAKFCRVSSAGQAILQRIVSQLGLEEAAYCLGISQQALKVYLNGTASVPDSLLLRAVDVLTDSQHVPEHRQQRRSQS